MQEDTTTRKMLRILDLVEDSDGPMLAEEMLEISGFTRSTLYRYLKVLTEAGLLSSISTSGFSLGPRIVELDYKMRQRDPLLNLARPLMIELAQSERCVALLCRRYRDRVLCIHQERGDVSFRSNYTRGLARPLFRGAASRVILANLKPAAIARLHECHGEEFSRAELGGTLAEVKASLRRLRSQGWDITEGQVTPGVLGVAVPLFDDQGEILGSLSVTLQARERVKAELPALVDRLKFCAGIVRNATEQHHST